MNFEVAALVTDGPMQNTYLGSVEWGWQSDDKGAVTLKPFVALASGAPTASYTQAATAWNNQIIHNTDGTTTDTVDLPTTTRRSGAVAAVDMRTADILTRLTAVRAELTTIAAGPSVERTTKEFEQRALDTELRRRKINVDLLCMSISDTGGAAVPAEDEVWLSLDGGGSLGATLTGTRTFRAGQTHTFQFPVTSFLPLSSAVHIVINEHDRAGPKSAAHDDALFELDWAPPFFPVTRTDTGGHYLVLINFDR